MSAFAIASTIGVPFSLYLANLFTWHAPFLLVGGLGIFIIPLVMKFVPPMSEHKVEKNNDDHALQVLLNVTRSREQRLALLFSCLVMLGHFLIIPFINPYMEFNKGYSKEQTPLIYLVGGIAAFFAAIILGRIADQVGKLKVFSFAVFLSFFFVWGITNMPNLPFALILAMFGIWFILGTGRAVTAQAMISNVVPPEQRGSFMTFNSSVQQLGTAIASYISGYVVIKDTSGKLQRFEWVGYLSIAVLFLGLMLGRYLFAGTDKYKMQNA
jgi:predicted MFS family arabinose efflux permease